MRLSGGWRMLALVGALACGVPMPSNAFSRPLAETSSVPAGLPAKTRPHGALRGPPIPGFLVAAISVDVASPAVASGRHPELNQPGVETGSWWNVRWATMTAAMFAVALAAGVIWSARLRRRFVAQKSAIEAELAHRVAIERRYRELTEGAPDGIYTVNESGLILSANPATTTLTGYAETELRGRSVLDLVPSEQRERVRERLLDRFTGGGNADSFEVEIVTRSGERRIVEVTSQVLRLPGAPACLEGVARDITERRRAQDAIETLLATTASGGGEEFFRLIVEQLSRVLRVDVVLIGVIEPGEPPGVRTLALFRGGEIADNIGFALAGSACAGVLERHQCVHPGRVCERFPADRLLKDVGAEAFVGTRLQDAEGATTGVLALAHSRPFELGRTQQDMLRILAARTGAEIDRLRSAAALRASEERFRQLAEQTADVLWVVDLAERRLAYAGPSFTLLTGVPEDEVRRNRARLLRLIHPEDRSQLIGTLRHALQSGASRYASEYRIIRADGTVRWILDEGVVVRHPGGVPYRISGVARDITHRKEAELALAAERERFRELFENSPDAVFVQDFSGTLLDVNRAACELRRASRGELLGGRLDEVASGSLRDLMGDSSEGRDRSGMVRREGSIRRTDGVQVPVELRVRRIRHEGRDALLVHARDVSERRGAEEFLAGQKRILEWIAAGRSVEDVLAEIARITDARGSGARACIHRFAVAAAARQVIAPGFPPATIKALKAMGNPDGPIYRAALGPQAATAAERRAGDESDEVVHIPLDGAGPGLTAVVVPILTHDGRALGAFSLIAPEPGVRRREDFDLQRLAASLAGVAIERHLADASLREGAERLQDVNGALLALARSEAIANGDLRGALGEIARTAAGGLGVERVSIWMFGDELAVLRCDFVHDRADAPPGGTVELRTADHGSYFDAVARERFVSVSNAANDPRTLELGSVYVGPLGITSLLDAGIRLGGRLVGVICAEHRGPVRVWRSEEELFVASLADVVAIALQAGQRRCVEEALRQSEEAYRSVVDTLAEGVMLVDRDGTFATFNESAAQILGVSPEMLHRSRLHEIPWETFRSDGSPIGLGEYPVNRTLRTGEPVSDSVLGVRRFDGTTVWLSINTRIFERDEQGQVSRVVVSFADITRRQAAERDLRLNHELLRAISDVQARFISDGDPIRTLEFMLQTLVRMTGSEIGLIAEATTNSDGSRSPRLAARAGLGRVSGAGEEPEALLRELLGEVLVSNRITRRTVPSRLVAADDHAAASSACHLLGIPVQLDNAMLGAISLARRDRAHDPDSLASLEPLLITCANLFGAIRTDRQRHEAEARIRQLNTELERRVEERTADLRATNEELAEFAYVVTHDLKAPLRGVHQIAEWLTDEHSERLDAEGLRLLQLMRERVRRLQRLVDGLLECARVGRAPEAEGTIGISDVVQDVVGVLAPSPHVAIDIPPDLPSVHGNPDRLHQIFQNLLDNAIKYADKPSPRVGVEALRRADGWEFRVKDNGPGIPERYREKVFLIFQRLHDGDAIPGTGLGLTLVKRIIESRGGNVWIESAPEGGTVIAFLWPDESRRRLG